MPVSTALGVALEYKIGHHLVYRVQPHVIRRLAETPGRGEHGLCGVLLGARNTVRPDLVVIEDGTSFADSGAAAIDSLRAAVDTWRSGQGKRVEAVGYFRVSPGADVDATGGDRFTVRSVFAGRECLLLVIGVDDQGRGVVRAWFHRAGGEIVDIAELGSSRPIQEPAAPSAPNAKTRNRHPAWTWMLLAVLATVVLTVVLYVVLPGSADSSSAAEHPPLRLTVQKSGEGVALRWDTAAAQNARQGVLSIRDGSNRRRVMLEADELRTGYFVYFPAAGDVEFRLEIVRDLGEIASASVHVLYAEPSAAPVSAPGPPSILPMRDRGVTPAAPRGPSPPEMAPSRDQLLRETNPSAGYQAARIGTRRRPELFVSPPQPVAVYADSGPDLSAPAGISQLAPVEFALPEAVRRAFEMAAMVPPPEAESTVILPGTSQRPPPPVPVGLPGLHTSPPVATRTVTPVWPASSTAYLTRTVAIVVRVTVDTKGRVIAAEAADTKGQGAVAALAVAATSAARGWRFRPAMQNGHPVEYQHLLIFHFKPN